MSILAQLNDIGISVRFDGDELLIKSRKPLTDEELGFLRARKSEIIAELSLMEHKRCQREARLHAVQDRLAVDPHLLYAWESHDDVDPEHVIVTVAVREAGACELSIERHRYDAFELLKIIHDSEGR